MWRKIFSGVLATAMTAAGSVWADDAGSGTPQGGNPPRWQRQDRSVEKAARAGQGPSVELGDFWLGLECYPAPRPLVEHLEMPGEGGLLVGRVIGGSPAEKAGVKQHDILLRADGKPTPQIADLVAAVKASEGKALELELIRGGKPMTLSVAPSERPRDQHPRIWQEPPRNEDFDRLWQWFGRMGDGEEWRRPFRMHFFHPGAILPPDATLRPALPADMTIVIQKQGDSPMRITVNRGQDTWEATEQEMDGLPDDVRPHVERMLGRAPAFGGDFRVLPWRADKSDDAADDDAAAASDPLEQPPLHDDRIEQQLERQLEEMGSRLEEMRRSLDRWRGDRDVRPRRKEPSDREPSKQDDH